jgi:hypothetical protein
LRDLIPKNWWAIDPPPTDGPSAILKSRSEVGILNDNGVG